MNDPISNNNNSDILFEYGRTEFNQGITPHDTYIITGSECPVCDPDEYNQPDARPTYWRGLSC